MENKKLSSDTKNINRVLAKLKEEWWEKDRKPKLKAGIEKTLEKENVEDREVLEIMKEMLDLVKPKKSSMIDYYDEEVENYGQT